MFLIFTKLSDKIFRRIQNRIISSFVSNCETGKKNYSRMHSGRTFKFKISFLIMKDPSSLLIQYQLEQKYMTRSSEESNDGKCLS